MTGERARRAGTRLAGAFGQAWLLAGITLLFFLVLEFGYRGAKALRARLSAPVPAVDSTEHPYAGTAWWPQLQRDLDLRRNRFDPYRAHLARPMASRYVNIDSLGRRITPQSGIGGARRQLFLLGGSTTWGYTARDSATIGAWLAIELRQRGIQDVEVVNLAQAAFNSTQEAATLVVELANGRIPALAVFLDGYNDIATANKYAAPGHTYGDEGIQQQIDLGRRGFWAELVGLGRHSVLVTDLQLRMERNAVAPAPTTAKVCGAVAGYYFNLTRMGESLGREYGFPVLYFLQPHNTLTRKPKTAWERSLSSPRLVPPCAASIDSAQAEHRGRTYFSLADLFDDDSTTVFIDQNAHLTEAANRRVAARIADVVAPLLIRRTP